MVDGFLMNEAEVHLLSLNTKKHFRKEAEYRKLVPHALKFDKVDVNTDISAWRAFLNLLSGKAFHVSRFYQKDFEKRLKRELKENDFSVIQIEGLSMAVYLPLIRKHSKASVVLRAHNIEFKIWQRHLGHENSYLRKWYLNLQARRLERFEKQIIAQVDATLFITKEDQRIARSWGDRILSLVAPCGLNPEDYPKQTAEIKFDLVHLASLDWLPNQQGALWFLEKVWPLVLEARPQTKMAFGGRNMTKEIIAKGSDQLWLYPEVKNAGDFIAQGKLAIIPLLAGSGMRIKLLEYLAWGKAVISTSIGAEGIHLKNEKEILLADEAEGFAAGVVYLLDNDEAREAMEKAAREYFEKHFNNQKLGREILQFFSTLL